MTKLKTLFIVLIAIIMLVPAGVSVSASSDLKINDIRVYENPGNTRITWLTSKSVATELHYGMLAAEGYETVVQSEVKRQSHSVALQSLRNDQSYRYKIIAVDAGGEEVVKEGTFRSGSEASKIERHDTYFSMLFENFWENLNNTQPLTISEPQGLIFGGAGFTGKSLQLTRPDSYLEYACKNNTHPAYGSVTVWVAFDRFDESAVIWQTDDSRYALFYEVGGENADFDKRLTARAGGTDSEVYFVMDPEGGLSNTWATNEWHFLTMTWQGKTNGQMKFYIDGREVGRTNYDDGKFCSTFRIGNSYRSWDEMNFSIGRLDEFKIHQWAMPQYYVASTYNSYSYSDMFEKKGQPAVSNSGTVSGDSIRSFKYGKIIKTPDSKMYVITRDNEKLYISDTNTLKKYGAHPVIPATYEEAQQYETTDTFYAWSRYPDGTLLKGTSATVYWVWDGEKRPIHSEEVFNRYGNSWFDVITVSDAKLNSYPIGFTYF